MSQVVKGDPALPVALTVKAGLATIAGQLEFRQL